MKFYKYFNCAESIEKLFSYDNKKTIWYLISDNNSLKQHFIKIYSNRKIFHQSSAKICHTYHENASCDASSFIQLYIDQVFFSFCDKYAITFGSGVGRNAILFGLDQFNSNNTFSFSYIKACFSELCFNSCFSIVSSNSFIFVINSDI